MMSEEVRGRGMGKTLVPVLSCNLVEELYTSAGQLVKRGKPEKVLPSIHTFLILTFFGLRCLSIHRMFIRWTCCLPEMSSEK